MTSSRRASLLVVFAHPDDEIFHSGMLMHLSQQGVRVTLVCATNGEAGKPHPSVGAVDDLGALRTEELRLSCQRLGIDPPVLLKFHDSARGERQRHGDARALANVDMLEVEAAIRRVIEDVRPQVLLTFDPHGGYYHPDHLAIHRATTAAFFSSGAFRPVFEREVFVLGGTRIRTPRWPLNDFFEGVESAELDHASALVDSA
jgi:N-acetyl-1-D-myo-inositol-2-amino-2-deoxy-alpha-D-glucopyranoside deacetylase